MPFCNCKDVVDIRRQFTSQFDVLIVSGEIKMDHKIGRMLSGRAHECGLSFKIGVSLANLLFLPRKTYVLA